MEEHESIFLLFAGAVMVSAWYGGLGPGLLSTALGALIVDFFYLPRIYGFLINDPEHNIPLGLFVAQGLLISALCKALHSARERVESNMMEARRSEERYRLIVGNIDEIVYLVQMGADPFLGKVEFVSDRVEKIIGYRPNEFLDDPTLWSRIVHPDDFSALKKATEKILAGQETVVREYRLQHKKTGEYRWVEDKVVLRVEEGRAVGLFGVARDITERKQAEAALERLVAELKQKTIQAEEASRMKSHFLSNVSHELRTPLNAIIGYVSLLLDESYGPLSERQKAPLERVRINTVDLIKVVEDVLDLSKIESGRMTVHLSRVDVPSVVQDVLSKMQPLAGSKSLSVRCDIGALPAIESDRLKISQILINLLSNAIKFTPKGGEILISTKALREKERIEIRVQDSGIGMRPEEIPKIFDAFHQIDASATREFGGVGLGLAIVKELVDLLGGEIRVESEYGKGSTFTLLLPYR